MISFCKLYSQTEFNEKFKFCLKCHTELKPGWMSDGPTIWADCRACNLSIDAQGLHKHSMKYSLIGYRIRTIRVGYTDKDRTVSLNENGIIMAKRYVVLTDDLSSLSTDEVIQKLYRYYNSIDKYLILA